jgi:hypothetical protein
MSIIIDSGEIVGFTFSIIATALLALFRLCFLLALKESEFGETSGCGDPGRASWFCALRFETFFGGAIFSYVRVCVFSLLPSRSTNNTCLSCEASQRECEVKTRGGKRMIFSEKFTPPLVLSNRQFDPQEKELG